MGWAQSGSPLKLAVMSRRGIPSKRVPEIKAYYYRNPRVMPQFPAKLHSPELNLSKQNKKKLLRSLGFPPPGPMPFLKDIL